MKRREFFSLVGTAAAATVTGVLVPATAHATWDPWASGFCEPAPSYATDCSNFKVTCEPAMAACSPVTLCANFSHPGCAPLETDTKAILCSE